MLNPDLLADLIAAGLPFVEGQEEPTRPLKGHEQNIYRALKIKYMPEAEKARALAKRPDLADLLDKTTQKISEKPLIVDLKDNYRKDLDKLNLLIDTSVDPEIVQLSKIIKRIYKLQARLIRADVE
jgi:hypothetical protein